MSICIEPIEESSAACVVRRGRPLARTTRLGMAALAAAVLMACGGGGGGSDAALREGQAAVPSSRSEAQRFLAQATFGPVDTDVERVMAIGYGAWIDEQFAKPASSHLGQWGAYDAWLKASNANDGAWQNGVFHSFWRAALSGEDQLRKRVAYALAQIFVISMADGTVGDNPQAAAAYLDMLADKGLANYRELLEAVALHPMMGAYLTHLRNQKADAKTGRVPDENFAREVMQLFSIGVVELNADGTPRLEGGAPVETYDSNDIAGLARVFTGWSWDCPDAPDNGCFFNGHVGGRANGYDDRSWRAMVGYPQYHSREDKQFLGVTIPAQGGGADPRASLKVALDTLAGHPNVGPFIGRQLIQRLVTSNPSPAYVAAVARVFADNGHGVRGDMRAVVKAVLTHPQARVVSDMSGKVREPVLRLSAFLRAFDTRSDSGWYRLGDTDNPGSALGQSVLRSPSVFNFYRPGYVPPGTQAAARGLVVPEMQIAHETTAAGYVNFMRDTVNAGAGTWHGTLDGRKLDRRDLQPNFSALLALAHEAAALVARVNDTLMMGGMPPALAQEIEAAVAAINVPALNKSGSNQASIDSALRNRVKAAVFLALVSPEYQVQK